MRLVYAREDSNAHSSTSQKTHVKAVAMLGLAFGLTTYIMQKIKRANESNTSPNYVKKPPRNLVFKGGGQKGIAYPAALKELERQGALKEIKRVAGTSAGAITAALVAVGYSPDELEQIIDESPLESFLDHPGSGVISKEAAVGLKTIQKAGALFSSADDAIHASVVHASFWGIQKVAEVILPRRITVYTEPFVNYLGDQAANKRQQILSEFTKLPALCPGEKFRNWMEDKIAHKTGIKYCTFGELDALAKENPKKYMELYVFAVELRGMDGGKIRRLGTISKDPELPCKDLIISDAVRCSMSIPFVFAPHALHYKNALGGRSPYLKIGKLVDGGLLINFPIDMFDDPSRETNLRTLGLGFEVQKANSAPMEPTIHGVASAYYNFQESLDDIRPHNTNRMILLPTQGVGTIPKPLSSDKKREVAEGARKRVQETFAKFRATSDSGLSNEWLYFSA